jgi:hypothetical protein
VKTIILLRESFRWNCLAAIAFTVGVFFMFRK